MRDKMAAIFALQGNFRIGGLLGCHDMIKLVSKSFALMVGNGNLLRVVNKEYY